jgi:hypothetical protein
MNNRESWDRMISFYETVVAEGQDLEPLLSVVKRIAATDYSEEFYPGVSHLALCISMARTSKEPNEVPIIAVQYMGDQSFKVWFRSAGSDFSGRPDYRCLAGEIWSLLEALFLRLNAEKESITN